MKLPIPNDRLEVLYDVLEYCSEVDRRSNGKLYMFSTFERICINQERGSIMSQMNQETAPDDIRHYQCPPKLESKIQIVNQKIINNNLNNQK